MPIQRYNGAHGYPEMTEANAGHWVTYESYQKELLDAIKNTERNWEANCKTTEKIRKEYDEQLSKQQTIITVLSAILFVVVVYTLFNVLGG